MKKKLLSLCLAGLLLLCGCNAKGGNADFTQRTLPPPDRMEIQTASVTIEYLPESEGYQKLWAALQPNWWKIAADKPDTAPDDALFLAESPEQLRFQSDRTYRESGDTFLYFYYKKEPFTWVNPTGPATDLTVLAFLLPGPVDTEEHVKSCFMAMKTNDVRELHGLFTYYFPPEIAASVWDFIRE